MREFSSPLKTDIPTTGNLTDDVVRNAVEAPDAVIFSRNTGSAWEDVTATQFLTEVQGVAKGLIAAGVEVGDRVAIISKTRYEWTLLDYAIWFAGAATVPVYETSSTEQVQHILTDSAAVAVVGESAEHAARIATVRAEVSTLKHEWSIDEGAIATLTELGSSVSDELLEQRRTTSTPDSLATLIYTSGTTGTPKGCILTHGNFEFELRVAVTDVIDDVFHPGASTLLFLPLAHVFARIIQIGAIKARARLGHSADIKNLVEDLGEFKPSFILAVPRVFEKVFNSASQKAHAGGKGAIFDKAAAAAIEWSKAVDTGKVPLGLNLKHALYGKLVYGKLKAALGGNCSYAISGGAPLGERLGHFYRGIGVTVLEGYGLTETTAALTVNRVNANKIGTVGQPFGGTSVRVAEDGELLFKGGQVFTGYWNNEKATKDVLSEDGWFHTGDVGEIDADGFVKITGRKKEIIVTAGGKNVAPAVLEDRLRANLLVDQCIVVGDGQPFIGALITLDAETLPTWAELKGKEGRTVEELLFDADLRAEIDAAVEDANKAVSRAESIRKYTILPASWSEEGGQLTPSLKLRRNVVMRDFREDVEALYLP